MKFSAFLCLLMIFACSCSSNNLQTKLLNEQKLLKDSTNSINDRIGGYIHKGLDDSAKAQKLQLGAVYTRLIAIQSSLDSLAKMK